MNTTRRDARAARIAAANKMHNVIIPKTTEKVRDKRASGALIGGIGGYMQDSHLVGDITLSIKLLEFMMKYHHYFRNSVGEMYLEWWKNNPPGASVPIRNALSSAKNYDDICYNAYVRNFGNLNAEVIIRLFPLPIFCEMKKIDCKNMLLWTKEDSLATHPHAISIEATKLYAVTLRAAVMGIHADDIISILRNLVHHAVLKQIILDSSARPGPAIMEDGKYNYDSSYIGNVLQTVLYELRHSKDFQLNEHYSIEQKCAVGAVLGAYYGEDAIPDEIKNKVLNISTLSEDINKLCTVDRKK